MTKVEADALLDAFLAAKEAGQEELWRETHPGVPDGRAVLMSWLLTNGGFVSYVRLARALCAVDIRCHARMAIYSAIVAYPKWDNMGLGVIPKFRAAPLDAIRAAIAYYNDPTEKNRLAASALSSAAWAAGNAVLPLAVAQFAGGAARAASHAAYTASYAAFSASLCAAPNLTHATSAGNAATEASVAISDGEVVIATIAAAIADHYEGRPLEMS